MNRFGRNDSMDVIFKLFPWIFGIVFVITLTVMVVQFAVVGYVGYKVLTDPEGSAQFIGTIAGEAIRPVADAVRGN
jgi:hypothetical protein